MSILHFKQAGVYHLQKLQHLIREKTGVRYKLGNEESLFLLIKEAIKHHDKAIHDEFLLFYSNCWPSTQAYIESEILPKGFETNLMSQAS
jgi:hypothetical protein